MRAEAETARRALEVRAVSGVARGVGGNNGCRSLQAKALERMEQMRVTFKQQALAKVQEAERAGLERCV
jgi:hypothetical protein